MPGSRGKGLKPPKVVYNLKFLGLYVFSGISVSKLKLTHGKPLCIKGIGKVSSWLDCSIASIASPVGVPKILYNGGFQNKFKSHFLPTDFLFCASLCLVERKGNMCRNTYNKYVFSMNEKGSPRSTYQPSVGVQKAFRAEEPGWQSILREEYLNMKGSYFYKIAHSSCHKYIPT